MAHRNFTLVKTHDQAGATQSIKLTILYKIGTCWVALEPRMLSHPDTLCKPVTTQMKILQLLKSAVLLLGRYSEAIKWHIKLM